jgi:hypothetical protein
MIINLHHKKIDTTILILATYMHNYWRVRTVEPRFTPEEYLVYAQECYDAEDWETNETVRCAIAAVKFYERPVA